MIPYNRQILHIDDDPQFTRAIAARLSPYGYDVAALHNPMQAIDELLRRSCRVVLLDIDMPGKNGLNLLREIKNWDGGVQVVMMTGMVSHSTVMQSLRWGAEACLFKPLQDIRPLVDVLERVMHKLEHWWQALADLSQRKRRETPAAPDAAHSRPHASTSAPLASA